MIQPLTVFIGFDEREKVAYKVCKASLEEHSSVPLCIKKLNLRTLQNIGLYTRRFKHEGSQMIDEVDGRPFSTEFAFSRFLVPALSLYDGWALFVDCDFLFTRDIAELMPLLNNQYAAMVVKHAYMPAETVKMDGQSQGVYRRKNWSSFCLWNTAHPDNRFLNIRAVNVESGKWLHAFSWLTDDQIGALPKSWNWLSGVSDPLPDGEVPAAIHFTLGTPDLPGYENSPYADLWTRFRASRETPLRPDLERTIP